MRPLSWAGLTLRTAILGLILQAGLHIGAKYCLIHFYKEDLLDVPALHWCHLIVGPYKWDYIAGDTSTRKPGLGGHPFLVATGGLP